jgi:flagellar motor protein MotB
LLLKEGVAIFIKSPPRVGRSQGASIFWGLISVCFAAAACFYYWENHRNETMANVYRDQALQLREDNESLASEKEHLENSRADEENQLKAHEELIQEKEAQLAQEETALEGLGRQSQTQAQQNLAQVTMVRKFNDVIRQVGGTAPDVVERGGRPVLRIPNAQLFAPGDAALTPDGKALLARIAQAINGQLDSFELRVVAYTDTAAEAQPGAGGGKTDDAHAASWALTSARAASLSRFFRDQTTALFLNVIVSGRGDAEPIVSNTGAAHARNRRVEITVTPLPVPFHSPDPDKTASDPAAPAKKGKPAPAKSEDQTPDNPAAKSTGTTTAH